MTRELKARLLKEEEKYAEDRLEEAGIPIEGEDEETAKKVRRKSRTVEPSRPPSVEELIEKEKGG